MQSLTLTIARPKQAFLFVIFGLLRMTPTMTRRVIGILSGAFLKFLFLAATVRFLMATMLDAPIVQKLSIMMSWPQFFTAVIGGGIALALLSLLKKS